MPRAHAGRVGTRPRWQAGHEQALPPCCRCSGAPGSRYTLRAQDPAVSPIGCSMGNTRQVVVQDLLTIDLKEARRGISRGRRQSGSQALDTQAAGSPRTAALLGARSARWTAGSAAGASTNGAELGLTTGAAGSGYSFCRSPTDQLN